ncbi:hypothetical protein [Alicycliphilus denitrificans]|uniref:hypothetical protein n=1 Tax=Alicycliphilus denitrificans TaxID=179636 RepID=UPI003851137F
MTNKHQSPKTSADWHTIRARGEACRARILRTDPTDGACTYLCSWNDSIFHAFADVDSLMRHLEQIEVKFAELQRLERTFRVRELTPEELQKERQLQSMWGRLGGMSVTISMLGKQLSGEMPIARSTLVMAEADGRNHLNDLAKRHADTVRARVQLADEIAAISRRPPRYAEYVAAAEALEKEGAN